MLPLLGREVHLFLFICFFLCPAAFKGGCKLSRPLASPEQMPRKAVWGEAGPKSKPGPDGQISGQGETFGGNSASSSLCGRFQEDPPEQKVSCPDPSLGNALGKGGVMVADVGSLRTVETGRIRPAEAPWSSLRGQPPASGHLPGRGESLSSVSEKCLLVGRWRHSLLFLSLIHI